MKSQFNNSSCVLKLGSVSSVIHFDQSEEITVLSQTLGEETFEWSLTNVQSSGTFIDGSPWVVPVEGKTIRLVDCTPRPSEATVTEGSVQAVTFTIRYNGMGINPKTGYEYSTPLAFATAGLKPEDPSIAWSFADNRHNLASLNELQTNLDQYFDISSFNSHKTAIETGNGIDLSVGDSVVLTKSFFDATDNRAYDNSNSYIPFTGDMNASNNDGDSFISTQVNLRTAIKHQAVLNVLSAQPPSNSFRPPVVWPSSGNRTETLSPSTEPTKRPIYQASNMKSLSSLSSLMSTFGHTANDPFRNFYPWKNKTTRDRILIGPVFERGGTTSDVLYSANMAQSNIIAYEDLPKTYGGNQTTPVISTLLRYAFDEGIDQDERETMLYRIIQYGIDKYGEALCLTFSSSGAGQKSGLSKQWILIMRFLLNQTTQNLEGIFEDFYGTDWTDLTDGQRNLILRNKFTEDFTICPVYEAVSNAVQSSEDSAANPARRAITDSNPLLGISYTGTLDNNAFVAADTYPNATEQLNETPLNYSEGGTDFIIEYSEVSGKPGFGRLEYDSVPIAYTDNVDPKVLTYFNLIGCKLVADGNTYAIIDCTPNMSGGNTNSDPRFIVVDRPFETTIDSQTSIEIYPFTSGDAGNWFWFRGGGYDVNGLQLSGACSSLWSDGYAQINWKATKPGYGFLLRALKELEGATDLQVESILGSWYKWFATYYLSTASEAHLNRQWMVSHNQFDKEPDDTWIAGYYTPYTLPGLVTPTP